MSDVYMYDCDGNFIGKTSLIEAKIDVNYASLPFEVENTPAEVNVNLDKIGRCSRNGDRSLPDI